jgi:hypothetical protein
MVRSLLPARSPAVESRPHWRYFDGQQPDGLDRERRRSRILLTNGNYVVLSPNWDNGAVLDAGAVTVQ